MKIVIDLPEKTIAHIRSDYGHGKGFYPLNEEDKKIVNDAIYFGTPLPKRHGRLGDLDRVKAMVFNASMDEHFMPINLLTCDDVTDIIDYTPTIIEGE